jgi:hypothetical protein
MNNINNLLVEKNGHLEVNNNLKLKLNNDQESAQFLIDSIRYWTEKRQDLFCNQYGQWESEKKEKLHEETKWSFAYKINSGCSRCKKSRTLLNQIFGDHHHFNSLPFVERTPNDREYGFSFKELLYFAENGLEMTIQLKENQKKEKIRKKNAAKNAAKARQLKKLNEKLDKKLNGLKINNELRNQILPFVNEKSLRILSADCAIVNTMKSIAANGTYCIKSGVGASDNVIVFYQNQTDYQSFQWRDAHEQKFDRPANRVRSIGKVKIITRKNVTVYVEIINEYNTRKIKFVFSR